MSIWQYREIKSFAKDFEPLTLNEANTPFEQIQIGSTKIFLKREDKNPTGSWKDRASAFKISKLKSLKAKSAVISSSGNAAISYLTYSQLYPELSLDVIVSNKNINLNKLEKIKKLVSGTNHKLHEVSKAKKLRAQLTATKSSVSLSSAVDDDVLVGYWSLGFEIASLINKEIRAKVPFFAPVSSGAALVGLIQGLSMRIESEAWIPSVYVCQTSNVHPVVEFNTEKLSEPSLADAITDKSCLRSFQIQKIIAETSGGAFAISNDELIQSKKIKTDLSYTSSLSISGLTRYLQSNNTQAAICIASGS